MRYIYSHSSNANNKEKETRFNCFESASRLVGSKVRKGDFVIYESTVYHGCTEEIYLPLLEKIQT